MTNGSNMIGQWSQCEGWDSPQPKQLYTLIQARTTERRYALSLSMHQSCTSLESNRKGREIILGHCHRNGLNTMGINDNRVVVRQLSSVGRPVRQYLKAFELYPR